MECDICASPTEDVVVPLTCYHALCPECYKRLKTRPCSFCRAEDALSSALQMPFRTYQRLFVDGSADLAVTSFDALLSESVKEDYMVVREVLDRKWRAVADYAHSDICAVCMSAVKHGLDLSLFDLYYACATVTRATVLDCLTSMYLRFGRAVCKDISPRDAVFHFFHNHCDIAGGGSEDFSATADFVSRTHHALLYDMAEVDDISNFINLLGDTSTCGCNTVMDVINTVRGGTTTQGEGSCTGPYVPTEIMRDVRASEGRINTSYRWVKGNEEDTRQQTTTTPTMVIDCLQIYSDCEICDRMMDPEYTGDLLALDTAVVSSKGSRNITTAVHLVSAARKYDREATGALLRHYTDPMCGLNMTRFISFHSLVKHSSSLRNSDFVAHLYEELFPSRRSPVCPVYHLAVICDKVVKADKSQLKKTKRDYINKWASRVIARHGTMRMKGRSGSVMGK